MDYIITFTGFITKEAQALGLPPRIFHITFSTGGEDALQNVVNTTLSLFVRDGGMPVFKDATGVIVKDRIDVNKKWFVPMSSIAYIGTESRLVNRGLPVAGDSGNVEGETIQ